MSDEQQPGTRFLVMALALLNVSVAVKVFGWWVLAGVGVAFLLGLVFNLTAALAKAQK